MNLDTLMQCLKSIPRYPFDPDIDRQFLADLFLEFPVIDHHEELKRLKLWLSEIQPDPRIHYRLLVRKWFKNASLKPKYEDQRFTKIHQQ